MSSDYDLSIAGFQHCQGLAPFRSLSEAIEEFDLHVKRSQTLLKVPKVLLREDRRGAHDRDLTPVLNRFERGTQRHFRLAISNVPAD
ncbi:MAG: hypothetical protein CNCCGFBP_00028 [Fimbriimonadaceae bacterium]|nr:hypothetical protein [Fimbriimonadaceae bacterium]